MLTFEPIRPAETLGRALEGLRVHVRDHRQRDLPVGVRTLEAHYGTFVVSQARRPGGDAARLALEVSYGAAPREARVLGRPGRVYELGPEPPPDDVDGRSPAVVVWHEDDLCLLVASGELPVEDLLRVAASMHAPR
jgi:hypothetical protein